MSSNAPAREVWGGLGCIGGDEEDRWLDRGGMAVSAGENRHPHTTRWLHPEEVSRHPREGLPGVPRRARPEAQATSAPAHGLREQGHGPLHDRDAWGVCDLLPLSAQSFGAVSGSGRAPKRTESDLLNSLADWGLSCM